MNKPLPIPVHWDRDFWDLAAQGILSAQRCLDCDHLQHYPRPACGKCLSSNRGWQHLSGLATVYSFTVVRRPFTPGFDDETPFVLLDVLLDEGLRMLSRLTDESQSEGLGIGDRLQVSFHELENGLHLPYFAKADAPVPQPS